MSHAFITGATGVVGSVIARQWLAAQPGRRLTLLLRAASPQDLQLRRRELLQSWRLNEAEASQVEALRGDVSLPLLGLSAAEHDRLAAECTHIIHCAALLKMTLPLEAARRGAVTAAQAIGALALGAWRRGQLRKLEFISTVGVGGRLPGTLPERWLHEPRRFHNTYEQAKAEAEDTIQRLAAEGLPVTVHRPSMVVGDSRSGQVRRFQVFYHLLEFLTGQRSMGLVPRLGAARLDIVPVDHVAAAVLWSCQQHHIAGQVLHLCSGPDDALPLTDLQACVHALWRARGHRLPRPRALPLALFRGALPALSLVAPPLLKRALGTLPVFLDYLETPQAFGNSATRSLLASGEITCPPPSSYLERVITHYLNSK